MNRFEAFTAKHPKRRRKKVTENALLNNYSKIRLLSFAVEDARLRNASCVLSTRLGKKSY